MCKLRPLGLLLGLLVVLGVNTSVTWGFDFKDLQKIKLPDWQSFLGPGYSIRLFNSAPLNSGMVGKILKKYQPGFSKEKLLTEGYTFPFEMLAHELKLSKAGMIKISNRGVEYDQIGSFTITRNASSGINHLEFIGKKRRNDYADFQFLASHCFIINVDENFIKRCSVKVHNLSEVALAATPDDLLPKVEAYLYSVQKRGRLDFVRKNASAATLRRKLADNFNYQVYQVTGQTHPKLLIICFEPKPEKGDHQFASFCCLSVNGKISKYGHFSDFIVFSIDKRLYMEFFNQVIPDSGYFGKMLYTLAGGKLNLVASDYSYAD